jgi:hypothetical protein
MALHQPKQQTTDLRLSWEAVAHLSAALQAGKKYRIEVAA